MINLRSLPDMNSLQTLLQYYHDKNLSFVLTLRWIDPEDKLHDVAPSDEEASTAYNWLIDLVKTPEVQQLGEHFWIQFYNELGGGVGDISYDDEDAVFSWASNAVLQIRLNNRNVRIIGPSLTKVDILRRNKDDLEGDMLKAYELAEHILIWGIEFGDAVDSHIFVASAQEVIERLETIRCKMNTIENGEDTSIVITEWGTPYFTEYDDEEAVRQVITEVWNNMITYEPPFASYASYWIPKDLPPHFQWFSLADEEGQPHEPFYSTIRSLAEGNTPGNNSQDNDDGDDNDKAKDQSVPDLWIAGGLPSPDRLKDTGAYGVRGIIDFRTTTGPRLATHLRDYKHHDLGLCLTLRWSDPQNPTIDDTVPTAQEATYQTKALIRALKSQSPINTDDHIWIQMFNELGGGIGQIDSSKKGVLFDFASKVVDDLRKGVPNIQICGPALTNTHLFTKETLSDEEQNQLDMLRAAISWSIEHADAIDVHITADDFESAKEILEQTRNAVDAEPGGQNLSLVCWQFNASAYSDHHNDTGSQQATTEVWRAVQEAGLSSAAYAYFSPRATGVPTDAWTCIFDERLRPNEPFYTTFREMAQEYQSDDNQSDDESDQESNSQQRRRITNPRQRR